MMTEACGLCNSCLRGLFPTARRGTRERHRVGRIIGSQLHRFSATSQAEFRAGRFGLLLRRFSW